VDAIGVVAAGEDPIKPWVPDELDDPPDVAGFTDFNRRTCSF
jgi:hypothetical protein